MIEFTDFTLTYPGADTPTLRDVNLSIPEGLLCLVTGATGSGKTSLLAAINGLVPHFTGGTVSGTVVVDGRETRATYPSAMADLVGYVGQDPARGFVTETVEYELAYGMEQAGVAPDTMRARVEETLDLLGIAHLRQMPVADLSGGEQQRVAIGSVLTVHPQVLVLDEPTSALDPGAAEEVLAVITRLVHDLGLTAVVAEHRLERIVQYADRVVVVNADGTVTSGEPRPAIAHSPMVPPVVELGRLAGWDTLPLSVREARRYAAELRDRLPAPVPAPSTTGTTAVAARGVSVSYGSVLALRDLSVELRRGEICVVMGRNGSGKSSLFWALHGALTPTRGSVSRTGPVGLVPQTPGDLLFLSTVGEECGQADGDAGRTPGTCGALLEELVPGIDAEIHPSDLSEGQRLALVLATQLVGQPDAVLLDEPTRGLDYRAKKNLAVVLRRLAADNRAVALSTHDVEFAALVADRVVVMAGGEIVSDGPSSRVLTATPLFAPQVAKVMAPLPFLTVAQVMEALA
jgi:energy-coupling factor transporter ATP-binding protein EcfA2